MIETGGTPICHVNVRPAIVIVVTYRNTKAPTFVRDPGLAGNILKFPVTQVVIERGARRLFLPLHRRDGRTVQEINVRPAVAVVVKDGDPT